MSGPVLHDKFVWQAADLVFEKPKAFAKEFNPDEARDDHGRWTSEGGGQSMPYALQGRNQSAWMSGGEDPRFYLDGAKSDWYFPDLENPPAQPPANLYGDRVWTFPPNAEQTLAPYYEGQRANLEQAAQNPIQIDVSTKALGNILEDGRMKTAFETRSSRTGGNYPSTQSEYVDKRMAAETNYLGVPADTPADQRPVYGYLTQGNYFGDYKYGNVTIELNNSVKDRSTMTAADSLDRRLTGAPMADALSGKLTDQQVFQASGAGSVRQNDNGQIEVLPVSASPYYEAQVHGGVQLSDIQAIHLPDPSGLATQRQLDNVASGKTSQATLDANLQKTYDGLVRQIQSAGIEVKTK